MLLLDQYGTLVSSQWCGPVVFMARRRNAFESAGLRVLILRFGSRPTSTIAEVWPIDTHLPANGCSGILATTATQQCFNFIGGAEAEAKWPELAQAREASASAMKCAAHQCASAGPAAPAAARGVGWGGDHLKPASSNNS